VVDESVGGDDGATTNTVLVTTWRAGKADRFCLI